MLKTIIAKLAHALPASEVSAHCDGPCGVYDPASARIAAEAVYNMTKKIQALTPPPAGDAKAQEAYLNTMARYIAVKEEQAQLTKKELLVLWTDYFKPHHLEKYPDLHDTFWKAAKLCSSCKVEVSLEHCQELMNTIARIHGMFWDTKEKDVAYYTASPIG